MTATELIGHLQGFLDERDGEDIEVRLDVDFDKHYPIIEITLLEDVSELDGSDVVMLQSMECVEAALRYDPRMVCPKNVSLN
jgi:hypothetical protein